MKRLLSIVLASTLITSALGQGTVSFLNGSYAFIYYDDLAGHTGMVTNGYYGLFTASSTVTSATALDLLTPTWTFTGLYATNIAAYGRLSGGNGVATLTGWPAGVTNSFLVAGWTSNCGHDWSIVSAELAGTLAAPAGALFGISLVSFGAAGGGTGGLPAFPLWSISPGPQGNGLTTGFTLYPIPEPATCALLVMAGLMFAGRRHALRRKK